MTINVVSHRKQNNANLLDSTGIIKKDHHQRQKLKLNGINNCHQHQQPSNDHQRSSSLTFVFDSRRNSQFHSTEEEDDVVDVGDRQQTPMKMDQNLTTSSNGSLVSVTDCSQTTTTSMANDHDGCGDDSDCAMTTANMMTTNNNNNNGTAIKMEDDCKPPPELSISFVGSKERKYSDGIVINAMSSQNRHNNVQQSSSTLSVNNSCSGYNHRGSYNHNNQVRMASVLSVSQQNSLASSINDLNYELEQLERAIRFNDVKLVTKMLESYRQKHPKQQRRESDQKSTESKRSNSKDSGDQRVSLLKTQAEFDDQQSCQHVDGDNQTTMKSRSGSSGDDHDLWLFSNALHLSIENNALDIVVLLLKNGFDPNKPGIGLNSLEYFQRSRNTSIDDSHDHLICPINPGLSTSREPLIRSPSIRSANLPLLLNPLTGKSSNSSSNTTAAQTHHPSSQQPARYFTRETPKPLSFQSIFSYPSSLNSDLFSLSRRSSSKSGANLVRCRSTIGLDMKTIRTGPDGTRVCFEEEYSREKLYQLPPIFLAVVLNNSMILRELIFYGGNVNIMDNYGVTPLHLCLCQQHISRACLRLLIQSGAKLTTKNDQNVSPLELVCCRNGGEEDLGTNPTTTTALAKELMYLQTSIIEECFNQLFQCKNVKRDLIFHAKHNNNNNNNNNNGNSFSGYMINNSKNMKKHHHQQQPPQTSNADPTTGTVNANTNNNNNNGNVVGTTQFITTTTSLSATSAIATNTKPSASPAINSTFSPRRLFLKDDSTESCGNVSNSVAKFLLENCSTSSIMAKNNKKEYTTSSIGSNQQVSNKLAQNNNKDVMICLDNLPEHEKNKNFISLNNQSNKNQDSGCGGGLISNQNSTLFPLANVTAHKRSFAIDSSIDKFSGMKSLNLSQSTLQLSCGSSGGSTVGNADGNLPTSSHSKTAGTAQNHQQQQPHHSSFGMGGRFFGRRRSGDENSKNQLKLAKLLWNRAKTQENPMEESSQESIIESMNILCKMADNIECIPVMINQLEKYLPEMIKLNETQQPLLSIIQDGFSKLLQKSFKCIVEDFCKEKAQIQSKDGENLADPSIDSITSGNSTKQSPDVDQFELILLKKKMSTQLCNLLICVFHCLKGGQTFQYTSLLIVNRIIDVFIMHETFNLLVDQEQVRLESESVQQTKRKNSSKTEPAFSPTTTVSLGKHLKHLRNLNETFNLGSTNKQQQQPDMDSSAIKSDKTMFKNQNEPEQQQPASTTSTRANLISWVTKNVHLSSPRLNKHPNKLKVISDTLKKARTTTINSKSGHVCSNNKDQNNNTTGELNSGSRIHNDIANNFESRKNSVQTLISILAQKGLDLLLNVLNNAITLHKRFSESKQLCVPSKRSRHCLYHCLQILSARAILYTSQSDDAQRRLIQEGPLKVLMSSIDSTNDPQLICLTLQTIANIALNPNNHPRLMDSNIGDALMQLILPSDEWFYTNHSTKYAKFVKHQAARIMVYLGLEKRLRNKVFLFDLIDDLGWHSPSSDSKEDQYIIRTSVAPNAVYCSQTFPQVLIGCSVENIVVDLVRKMEEKFINGEDSLCIDPLNEEPYCLMTTNGTLDEDYNPNPTIPTMAKDPPAIQVDMPSGLIQNHHVTANHPNCFFYLSTLPMTLPPIILLRVLQHRMFGSISYYGWQTSRASVASSVASSFEAYNRSRANSNVSNYNFGADRSNTFNLKHNIDWHCSNFSLSPPNQRQIDLERRMSAKGFSDVSNNRLIPQNSFPLGAKSVPISDCLSNKISRNSMSFSNKLSIRSSLQRSSMVEPHHIQHFHNSEQYNDTMKTIKQQQLQTKHLSLSIDDSGGSQSAAGNATDPATETTVLRNNSIDTSQLNEAYIISFQREIQNLPKSPSASPTPLTLAQLNDNSNNTNDGNNNGDGAANGSLTAIIRETLENVANPFCRPRSCSVPRITLENLPTILLHLPNSISGSGKNPSINQMDKNQPSPSSSLAAAAATAVINPECRYSAADVQCNSQFFNFTNGSLFSGINPNLSPNLKRSIRNLNESPKSCASTFRTRSGSTRSGSRSGSTCQVINEGILPNVHKAILKLLLDWINICPDDFQHFTFRRELIDFLNRVSMMGEQYHWICDEIRFLAMINEGESATESPSSDTQINKEYESLQKLILNGQLPCSKEEAVVLAVIQLRIEETSPPNINKHDVVDVGIVGNDGDDVCGENGTNLHYQHHLHHHHHHDESRRRGILGPTTIQSSTPTPNTIQATSILNTTMNTKNNVNNSYNNNNNNKNIQTNTSNNDSNNPNKTAASVIAATTLLHPNSIMDCANEKHHPLRRSIGDNVKENTNLVNLSKKLFGEQHTNQTNIQTTTATNNNSIVQGMSSSSFDEMDENDENLVEQRQQQKLQQHHDRNLCANIDSGNLLHHHHHHLQRHSQQQTIHQPGSKTKSTTNRIIKWMSSNWNDHDYYNFSTIDARRCLPPIYQNCKNISKTIKEQKRKLFHTSVYESEQQLKKLYIQTCKRLPAYGCRLFQVKELLHGRTNRRATRLLGICLERIVLLDCQTLQLAKTQPTTNLQQWRAGGGRSHDRLVLEFRGTQWSFITSSHNSLRTIGTVLWEILQSLDSSFLDTFIALESQHESSSFGSKENMKFTNKFETISPTGRKRRFRDELLRLESMLHSPEEVAFELGKVEYELFYNIQPVHYIRQVTTDLSVECSDEIQQQQIQGQQQFTVKDLIERFHEVSSWTTQLIISQPTHEMRKAVLSCIIRVVQTCWNMGNFNSAVEILAGLKSEKLKPFWLSIEQKDDLILCNKLSQILLTLDEPTDDYKKAVVRALDIPHSLVIPFFGAFLCDLKNILKKVPSLIVLSNERQYPPQQQDSSMFYRDSVEAQSPTPRIDSISEFNGDNNYMSRIGVGGIINMDKMYKAHQVLDNLRTFHIHSIRRNQLITTANILNNRDSVDIPNIVHSQSSTLFDHQQSSNNINNNNNNNRDLIRRNSIIIIPDSILNECSEPKNSKNLEPQPQSPPIVMNDLNKEVPDSSKSLTGSSATTSMVVKKENNQCYMIDMDCFKPIQPMNRSHGISMIPLSTNSIDLHILQAMHHGTTIIHYEEDTGRSSMVYLQLEQSNSMIAWCRPFWSTSLHSSGNTPQDYQLSLDIEDFILPGISLRYETKEPALIGLDEGFIDLMSLKDIFISPTNVDLSMVGRRHGFNESAFVDCNNCSLRLLFGLNLSDNRTTEFIAPKMTLYIWYEGLKSILKLIQKQKRLTDQRVNWLKEKYLQSYYEESACQGPTPAEAIRMFGGRKWTVDAMGSSHQSLQNESSMNKTNNSNKFRKKKSVAGFTGVNREFSNRSQLSINSVPDHILNNHRADHTPIAATATATTTPLHGFKLNPSSQTQSNEQILSNFSSLDDNNANSSSCEYLAKSNQMVNYSPIHTTMLTSQYREKYCKRNISNILDAFGSLRVSNLSPQKFNKNNPNHCFTPAESKPIITHSANLSFFEFFELFRSFLICIRRDVKDIFEQIASKSEVYTMKEIENNHLKKECNNNDNSKNETAQNRNDSLRRLKHDQNKENKKFLGLLTRNSLIHLNENYHKNPIFDAISAASIVTNSAGIDSLNTSILTCADFHAFITTYQAETVSIQDVEKLVQIHEPNPMLRKRHCLSFEGFARYLMDKDNFAYQPELNQIVETDMDEPLSHYYIATSHNTYLTGHQLKGESSVELYSQVLLTGCRCVELDCWDGDDGMPVIYHGHTLTSKIPFKKVVETINEKAFIASPYPVILSLENHCSLQQQAKMAQIFGSVFGEKLVTKFLFESDYADDPRLPSPNQLKYRILIKNKKLRAPSAHMFNPKMRINLVHSKSINGRANSLVSNTSTNSFNDDDDDEYDDEDDDDEVEELLPMSFECIDAPDKKQETNISRGSRQKSLAGETDGSNYGSPLAVHNKMARKSSSQIAPELSDLVIYCQAIKFRGLMNMNPCTNPSPTNSAIATPVAKKVSVRKIIGNQPGITGQNLLNVMDSGKVKDDFRELNNLSPTYQPSNTNYAFNKRPNSSAFCYQITSINENTAKKLCRKNPLSVVSHTESQIMRTYPTRMRIDSSNFNPVIFWAFGIQCVALNYQTVDTALQINTAMFEQNGGCGFVLKSKVMRDKTHMMYGRFNPWDKEFDGLHTINLTITIISGQYVCPNTNTGSPQVDVETIGIPVDCNRQRTKIVQRNSLNPIWNDTFQFKIKFVDLAFLRITVTDVSVNQMAAQLTFPVKCLRQGYRHMRLKNPQNQNLPLSTLFVYSCYEEEGLDIQSDAATSSFVGDPAQSIKINPKLSRIDLNKLDVTRIDTPITAPVKRRMFFLVVHGVIPEESSTILKITQDSTVNDVIGQALARANKSDESVNDYVLLEEVNKGWEKSRSDRDRNSVTQRILEPNEHPLEAQNNWKGEGKLVLKKLADDPSTRAWMTTIRSASAHKEHSQLTEKESIGDWEEKRDENETFLVCIYNVSKDQPYAILKATVTSTAQDIISQALHKAHRDEDPKLFVLVEETESFIDSSLQNESSKSSKNCSTQRRVVDDGENIYDVQTQWKNKGKFELKYGTDIVSSDNTIGKSCTPSTSKTSGSLRRLSKMHRTCSKRFQRKESSGSMKDRYIVRNSEPHQPDNPIRSIILSETRQVHSDGEISSDFDEKTSDGFSGTNGNNISSFRKFKRLSMKRLKAWKS